MALAEVHAEEFYLSAGECGPEQTLFRWLCWCRVSSKWLRIMPTSLAWAMKIFTAHGQT